LDLFLVSRNIYNNIKTCIALTYEKVKSDRIVIPETFYDYFKKLNAGDEDVNDHDEININEICDNPAYDEILNGKIKLIYQLNKFRTVPLDLLCCCCYIIYTVFIHAYPSLGGGPLWW
jgi:hypothetical protein